MQPKVCHAKKKRRLSFSDSSDVDDLSFESDPTDDNDWKDQSSEDAFDVVPGTSSKKELQPHQNTKGKYPEVNDYMAAVYENEWFVAFVLEAPTLMSDDKLTHTTTFYYNLRFMEKKGNNKFIWPKKVDEIIVPSDDILNTVQPPVSVSSRHVGLSQSDLKNVEKLFLYYVSAQ